MNRFPHRGLVRPLWGLLRGVHGAVAASLSTRRAQMLMGTLVLLPGCADHVTGAACRAHYSKDNVKPESEALPRSEAQAEQPHEVSTEQGPQPPVLLPWEVGLRSLCHLPGPQGRGQTVWSGQCCCVSPRSRAGCSLPPGSAPGCARALQEDLAAWWDLGEGGEAHFALWRSLPGWGSEERPLSPPGI